ncbi:PucR family transcriptional regulator [Streptomyces sp. NPDC001020]
MVAAVTLRADGPEVHHALGDEGIGHLVLVRDDLVLVAIPDSEAAVATLRTAAERIGLSEPVSEQRQVPGAAREARFALSEAVTRRQAVARHGEGQLLPPRSAGEAEAIVRNVLTPLLEYDAAHDARLTHSLRVFLEENRSWQRAAARLHIHKQTLVYRMGRVAELSGRALDTTHGVAELWLALEAYEATRIPGQGH